MDYTVLICNSILFLSPPLFLHVGCMFDGDDDIALLFKRCVRHYEGDVVFPPSSRCMNTWYMQ